MIDIFFDKLYRYPRVKEPCSIAIPVKEGTLNSLDKLAIIQEGKTVPMQAKVTSRHKDGSIRYIFVRFMADLPANQKTKVVCDFNCDTPLKSDDIDVKDTEDGYIVNTGKVIFSVKNHSSSILNSVDDGNKVYTSSHFEGPYLKDGFNHIYDIQIDQWRIVETGAVCTILAAQGSNISCNGKNIDFEVRITAFKDKEWIEISYKIINTSSEELKIASLVFYAKADKESKLDDFLSVMDFTEKPDSTGCGDQLLDNSMEEGPIFHTRGIHELDLLEKKAPVAQVRTLVGISNYKTDFYIGKNGQEVNRSISDQTLVKEANEHYAEVFYGTFMADRTDSDGGLCITVYQAHQNYPKAIKSCDAGIAILLVPEGFNDIVMQPGMAREQKFLMHFHSASERILELDNRSLIYQMPDRPYISPDVFKNANVCIDVFPDKLDDDVEIALISKCDAHARCYGMLNWGDTWDSNYTMQGRGNGRVVWSNNEYDFPHACALIYARTGIRRFLDYLIVTATHWMDVDVCHYSDNPLYIGGQWEHTAGHCKNGLMVCSHEWCEGLLDYYHFTGDERGLETAIGIGNNVLRLLETPMYATPGEANARETGWALRTLTALYVETYDEKWLKKSEWIIDSFKKWEDEYGSWLAPYTDNTTIRVGFMMSVAIGSVMRYYRVFPREDIKQMMIRQVDDLIENSMTDCGLFYYKELPSIQRLGNNTLLLEALAIAYELTGDVKYLRAGIKTFSTVLQVKAASINGRKRIEEDAVICAGESTKTFAQSFIPLITYYKAISDNDITY